MTTVPFGRRLVRSSRKPPQIHDRKYSDPDDVKEMPKEAETQDAYFHTLIDPEYHDLHDHHDHPDAACQNVQAMGWNENEKRRQKAAACGCAALREHRQKVVYFETEKAGAEQQRHAE